MMALVFGKLWNVTGRFYDRGPYDAAPDHILLSFKAETSGGEVDGLACDEDTKISLEFENSITLPDRIRVIAYRSDSPDNAKKFDTIIKGREENLVTNPGATTINGILKNPAEASHLGLTTTVSFHVDFTAVNAGERYYFEVIVVDSTNDIYTAFISPEWEVQCFQPTVIEPILISQSLDNYNQTSAGNCIAVPTERLRARMEVNRTSFNTEVQSRYGGTDVYEDYLQDVKFTIFDADTLETLQAETLSGGGVFIAGTGGGPPLSTTYEITFRLKGTGDSKGDWQGRNLLIEWEQIFFYPAALINRDEDHIDRIRLNQFVEVRLIDPEGAGQDLDITLRDQNGLELFSSLCGVTLITAEVSSTPAFVGNLIAGIDKLSYDATKQEEEESYLSPQGLAQLSSPKLQNVDTAFAAGIATFEIDPATLEENKQYRIWAIALT